MSNCHDLRRRYTRANATHLSGMTLIELLIAMAIASTLAVAGYRALASLTGSARTLTETTQRWQALDAHATAIERAYRRAAPGMNFAMAPNALKINVLAPAQGVSAVQFGAPDETVRGWAFAAWDGTAWISDWNAPRPPAGLRVTMTTVQGDVTERVYAL